MRDPRIADNCRPLISVADTFGEEYGRKAREALVRFCASSFDRSPHIRALKAAAAVCEACEKEANIDYIEGKTLAKAIAEEDDHFIDWRGANDKGKPHELTSGELSRLLRLSGVRSQTCLDVQLVFIAATNSVPHRNGFRMPIG
jgi:Protein of unknown function (DUF3631)